MQHVSCLWALLFAIVIVYAISFALFTLVAWKLYETNGMKTLHDNYDNNSLKLLREVQSDRYVCFHCVNEYSNYDDIEKIIQLRSYVTAQENHIKYFKVILNLFGVCNTVLIFIIYRGPVIVSVTTCIISIIILIVSIIDNIKYIFQLESTIVVFSFIISLRSCYSIIMALFEILEKNPKKQ